VKFGIVCTEKEKKRIESRKYKETGVEPASERLENEEEEEEERKRSEYHSIAFSHCSPDSVVVFKREREQKVSRDPDRLGNHARNRDQQEEYK
jgi:hypothetical protein